MDEQTVEDLAEQTFMRLWQAYCAQKEEIERLEGALRDVMNRSRDHNDAIGIANNALAGLAHSAKAEHT